MGAGNCSLVILAALIFGGIAMGVDRRTPNANCQAELYYDNAGFSMAEMFMRLECCVSESDWIWEKVDGFMKARNKSKIVVICKHLCGTGSDYCIKFLGELHDRSVKKSGGNQNLTFLG